MTIPRPVYKQDLGENYVYYSSAAESWLVGCLVGHRHGWLRNRSPAAASSRYPSLLSSGWEVRDEAGDLWTGADRDIVTFQNIKGEGLGETVEKIKSTKYWIGNKAFIN